MSHHISAIITRQTPELKELRKALPIIVKDLPQGFVIALDTLSNRTLIKGQDFAAIWTEYFGGCGEQGCTLFRASQKAHVCDKCGTVLVPAEEKMNSINAGLKELGVVRTGSDEFDAINLGHYRNDGDIDDRFQE